MMMQTMIDVFADSHRFVSEVVADVPETRMAEQVGACVNHPAWTLTHLATSNDFLLTLLGRAPHGPEAWGTLAGPGSKPTSQRSAYAEKSTLCNVLDAQVKEISAVVGAMTPEQFAAESPEAIRAFAATIGHVVVYMLAAHNNYHLAQLYTWKRAVGLMA
jgi:hypothetical protein